MPSLDSASLRRTVEEKALPEYLPFLREGSEDALSADLAALSVFLAERLGEAADPVSAWRAARLAQSRVCYVPSTRAEAAYAVCAKEKENVTVSFAENAELGCADLVAENVDYLLLPYASASGSRLVSTERLVDRYDLYTAATVCLPEEEGDVIYGLFSARSTPFVEKGEMQLSLHFTVDSYSHLGRMLTAFSALGFTVEELSTSDEDYGRVASKAVLRENGNYAALWLYLCLYAGSFSFLGWYPRLSAEN